MTELNHTQYGEQGPPIIMLHGLLGMARNWASIARRLSDSFRVFTVDLPNHGDSPQADIFTYDTIAESLVHWANVQDLEKAIWLGHSLGGRAAMRLATCFPEKVDRLVIVDISASTSPPRWQREIAIMRRLDVANLTTRQEAEDFLEAEGIEGWAFRKFLVSNLERDPAGGFRWKPNLDALEHALPRIFDKPIGESSKFQGPALLIRGADSGFVPDGSIPEMQRHFPELVVESIPAAGHNVHVDQPERFLNALIPFISGGFERNNRF